MMICRDGGRRVTPIPLTADLQGRISGRLVFGGTHVRCQISAPRHQTVERTVPVVARRLEVGQVRMARSAALRIGPAVRMQAPNGSHTILDIFVENEAPRPIQVRRVEIAGSARATTSCLDPRPALIFNIRDIVAVSRGLESNVSVANPATGWRDQVAGTGTVTRLGCRQVRVEISIPYLFSLAARERQKIRLAIPRSFRQARRGQPQALDLSGWEALRVGFVTADGVAHVAGVR